MFKIYNKTPLQVYIRDITKRKEENRKGRFIYYRKIENRKNRKIEVKWVKDTQIRGKLWHVCLVFNIISNPLSPYNLTIYIDFILMLLVLLTIVFYVPCQWFCWISCNQHPFFVLFDPIIQLAFSLFDSNLYLLGGISTRLI